MLHGPFTVKMLAIRDCWVAVQLKIPKYVASQFGHLNPRHTTYQRGESGVEEDEQRQGVVEEPLE